MTGALGNVKHVPLLSPGSCLRELSVAPSTCLNSELPESAQPTEKSRLEQVHETEGSFSA